MKETILTWNVHNWITVVLMFLLAWAVLQAVATVVRSKNGMPGYSAMGQKLDAG